MTDGVPNIVPTIGGLVGIGIMAGAANQVIKTVGKQTNVKGKKKKMLYNTNHSSFSSNSIEQKIRKII